MKKTIAIVGYGRFGRSAAHHLKKKFHVLVSDSRKLTKIEKGVYRVSLRRASASPVIILAVPIGRTASLLKQIAPWAMPGALICDVCSVKVEPLRWMTRTLPRNVFILGTHPLFGPDSAGDILRGRSIILCPVRIPTDKLRKVRRVLKALELNVVMMSPVRHDRLMASTLFLTQLMGRSLSLLHLPPSQSSTPHFQFLHRLVQVSNNDSKRLFTDMYRFNRFARPIPRKLISAFEKIDLSLRRGR